MNRKAETLLEAFSGLPAGSTIVEIGCVRHLREIPSDGYSTVHLARAGAERGWQFYSVDIDPVAVGIARRLVSTPVELDDGAAWLRRFGQQIDGLYLDGAIEPQQGVDQYEAAPLAEHCVIAIDDIQQIGDLERGKGDLLLDRLEADGFAVQIKETVVPAYLMAVAIR